MMESPQQHGSGDGQDSPIGASTTSETLLRPVLRRLFKADVADAYELELASKGFESPDMLKHAPPDVLMSHCPSFLIGHAIALCGAVAEKREEKPPAVDGPRGTDRIANDKMLEIERRRTAGTCPKFPDLPSDSDAVQCRVQAWVEAVAAWGRGFSDDPGPYINAMLDAKTEDIDNKVFLLGIDDDTNKYIGNELIRAIGHNENLMNMIPNTLRAINPQRMGILKMIRNTKEVRNTVSTFV